MIDGDWFIEFFIMNDVLERVEYKFKEKEEKFWYFCC